MIIHSQEWRSVIAWSVAFLSIELCAHYRTSRAIAAAVILTAAVIIILMWPVYTLSSTTWVGEAWWWPIPVFVFCFMLVLLCHLEFHWSVRYLIAVSVAGAALIASHVMLVEHQQHSASYREESVRAPR